MLNIGQVVETALEVTVVTEWQWEVCVCEESDDLTVVEWQWEVCVCEGDEE